MASVTVSGTLRTVQGDDIPVEGTLTEGTEGELTTNSGYTSVAQSIGDYAPGATISHANVECPNGASYAYILRQGLIAALIPISVSGVNALGEQVLPAGSFTLQPGDKLQVLALTATARNAALQVVTSSGVPRIFVVTPSGAATNELIDLQTSNSIGDTLQGATVAKMLCTSVDGSKITGGGAVIVNNLGNVAGANAVSKPASVQPMWTGVGIPIALNFKAQIVTSS